MHQCGAHVVAKLARSNHARVQVVRLLIPRGHTIPSHFRLLRSLASPLEPPRTLRLPLLTGGVARGRVVARRAEVRERAALRGLVQASAVLPQTSQATETALTSVRGAGAVATSRAHAVDEVLAPQLAAPN